MQVEMAAIEQPWSLEGKKKMSMNDQLKEREKKFFLNIKMPINFCGQEIHIFFSKYY